jgi:hypothetical protein
MTNSHKCLFPTASTSIKMIDTLPKAPRTFSEDPNVNFDNLKKLISSYTHIHISQQATYNGKKRRGARPSDIFNPAGLNYDVDPKDWSVEDEPQIKQFVNALINVSSRSVDDCRGAMNSIGYYNNAFSMELIKMDDKVKKLDQNKSSWDADEINLRTHVNTLKSFIKLTSSMKDTLKIKLDQLIKEEKAERGTTDQHVAPAKANVPYFLTAQR